MVVGRAKRPEAGGQSDTFMSHVSLGNYRGLELRLHIPGFVPFIPGTLEVDHKVVKSVSVRLWDGEVKQFERSHSTSFL